MPELRQLRSGIRRVLASMGANAVHGSPLGGGWERVFVPVWNSLVSSNPSTALAALHEPLVGTLSPFAAVRRCSPLSKGTSAVPMRRPPCLLMTAGERGSQGRHQVGCLCAWRCRDRCQQSPDGVPTWSARRSRSSPGRRPRPRAGRRLKCDRPSPFLP